MSDVGGMLLSSSSSLFFVGLVVVGTGLWVGFNPTPFAALRTRMRRERERRVAAIGGYWISDTRCDCLRGSLVLCEHW